MLQAQKRISKDQVLAAIKQSYNNTSAVASRLGVDWHTADRLIKKWTETRKAFEDELETINDMAQNKAVELIRDKDAGMIKWWLSKKAKKRGFGDEPTDSPGALNGDLNGPTLQIEIIDDLPHNNAPNEILEPLAGEIIDEGTTQNEN